MPRLIITKEVELTLTLLSDYADDMQLINALIKRGQGEDVDTSVMYEPVKYAYQYIIKNCPVLYWGDPTEESQQSNTTGEI